MRPLVPVSLFWGALFWLLLSGAAACQDAPPVAVNFKTKSGAETPPIRVEVAATPAETSRGLMYRKEMARDRGMLFIFPAEVERSFWMKNTYLELDMVFLNSDFRIVSITHRAVPLTETPRPSKRPAKYVLEVNGGQAEEWKLGEGDLMVVKGELPQGK